MDTLKAAQDLEKAGFPKPQAEAISRIVNDLGRSKLGTKDSADSKIEVTLARLEVALWKRTVAIIGTSIVVFGILSQRTL